MPTPKPKTKPKRKADTYDVKRAERLLRNPGGRTTRAIAEELGTEPANLYALAQRMRKRAARDVDKIVSDAVRSDEQALQAKRAARGAQGSGSMPAAAVPDSPANATGREALRIAKDIAAKSAPGAFASRLQAAEASPTMDPYKTIERLRGELSAMRADNDRLRAKSNPPIVGKLLRENNTLRALLNTALEQVGLTVQSAPQIDERQAAE